MFFVRSVSWFKENVMHFWFTLAVDSSSTPSFLVRQIAQVPSACGLLMCGVWGQTHMHGFAIICVGM